MSITSIQEQSGEPKPSLQLSRPVSNPRARVLFLGYSQNKTSLPNDLADAGCEVWHTEDRINSIEGFDLVVSYGYRHILKGEILSHLSAPIVNLHISYLPWNRGAHPNFWSFFDGTPSGVSIHLIDKGIDTGPVIFQKYVNFDDGEKTFSQTYNRLIMEIEDLFRSHIEQIVSRSFVAIPQRRKGTYHRASDLPSEFRGWDSEIRAEILRLDKVVPENDHRRRL
jgi:methionyl-tRNA formyltransferase